MNQDGSSQGIRDLANYQAGPSVASLVITNGNLIATFRGGATKSLGSISGDPSIFAALSGATYTGPIVLQANSGPLAQSATSGQSLQVVSDGTPGGAAFINFNRPGAYSTRFGLSETNEFSFGGSSEGTSTKYRFWTEKNFDPTSISKFKQPRTAAVSRDVTARFNEGEVSLDDFKLAGDVDDTSAWQRAHDAMGSGGIVNLPARDLVISGQVLISNPVWFRGKGWCEQAGTVSGTRILLPSTAKSPFRVSGSTATGVMFSDFAIVQTGHPVPPQATTTGTITSGSNQLTVNAGAGLIQVGAVIAGQGLNSGSIVTAISGSTLTISSLAYASVSGLTLTYYNPWSPTIYPNVFDCIDIGGLFCIDNLICFGIYQLVSSVNSGRFEAYNIYGHFFSRFVLIDKAYDSCRIDHIHAWPYAAPGSPNVWQYTQSNMDLITLGRCDTPFIDNIFSIFGRHTLYVDDMGSGVCSRALVGRVQADGCYSGLAISARTNNAWIGIAKLDAQCEGPSGSAIGLSGSSGVIIFGNNNIVTIDTLNVQYTGASSVNIAGVNNTLSIGSSYIGIWGQVQTSYPAFALANVSSGAANTVRLATLPVINAGGGNARLTDPSIGSNAVFDGFPPIPFTPTVSSTAGAITAYSVGACYYTRRGSKISFVADFTIANNGNGSGNIQVSLPFINSGILAVAFGSEQNVNGLPVIGRIGAGQGFIVIVSTNNAYPGVNGARFVINGDYYPAVS